MASPPRFGLSLTLLAITGVLIALKPAKPGAHPTHGPSLGERYVKIEVREDRLRTVYGLTYAARHGQRVRALADGDQDGRVSPEEETAFGQGSRQKVREALELTIDGETRELEWSDPFVNAFAGPIVPGPATIEMTAELELPPGAHLLTVGDRAEFTGIYRTNVSIVTRGEVELRRAGKGRNPQSKDRRFVFMDLPSPGQPAARVATVEVLLPGSPPMSASALWGLILGVVMVVVLGLGLLIWTRWSTARRRGTR